MIMRKLIMRENHEFKMRANDKKFNPAELKNKCQYIVGNYMSAQKAEALPLSKVMNFDERAQSARMQVFAELFFKIETAG